jgi:transcriptional regulator with XRE-family HTH domain
MLWLRKHKAFAMITHSPTFIRSSEDLGALVVARRKSLNITQEELASITGVDQANLSRIERGMVRAEIDTYIRLLSALGIDLLGIPRA